MTQLRHIMIAGIVLLVAVLGAAGPVAAADAESDTMADAEASEKPLDLSKTTVGLLKTLFADTEQIIENGITL